MQSRADLAFVFPGQGSQAVGMMDALAAEFPQPRARFDEASSILGIDLWALATSGPDEELNRTQNTQPALLAASVACWDIWLACGGPQPAFMAGHSFGEYSALVCAGAIEYADGVRLSAARGRYMQEAVSAGAGAMAAILGLELTTLEQLCANATTADEVCACANLNAPGQIVISGSSSAVAAVCEAALTAGAKRAMPLAVSAPAHCALMAPAAHKLAAQLEGTTVTTPGVTILHNADVASHADPQAIRAALVAQMCAPVRWIETVEKLAASGVTTCIECGPGKVLGGLIKRIDRSLANHPFGNPADVQALAATLKEL